MLGPRVRNSRVVWLGARLIMAMLIAGTRLLVWYGFRKVVPDQGFYVLTLAADGNDKLFELRLREAMHLLSRSAPTHMRWLRRGFPRLLIVTAPGLPEIIATPTSCLMLSPKFVWRLSSGQLAAELGARAAARRQHFPNTRSATRELRIRIRMARERVWIVDRLPEAVLVAPTYHRALIQLTGKPRQAGQDQTSTDASHT